VELDESDAEARYYYALSLAQQEEVDQAEAEFKKVVEQDPDHADAHYNLGVAALFNERAEEALRFFEKALEAEPEHALAENGRQQVQQLLSEK
jgi:tetratricopeptide (TPR) repeat protein